MSSQSFLLTESHGLDRTAEPVSVTASFYPKDVLEPEDLRLLNEEGEPVNIQITDLNDSPSTGQKTRPSRHCRLHFLADLPAYGQKKYKLEISQGKETNKKQDGPIQPDIRLTGKGPSLYVENQHLGITLDPGSGRIYALKNKSANVILTSPLTLQWNLDSYDPNREGPPPFSWDPPPKITFERGPIFFELHRSGKPKGFPEMTLHMTYRLYAQAPYLWVRTVIEIHEDIPLISLQNNELIFKQDSFTHIAWQKSSGETAFRSLNTLQPINSHGDILNLEPNVPWVGFFHPEQGHAISMLQLRSMNFNRLGRPLRLRDHSTYLIKNEKLKCLYWARPFIYWPHHTKRDQLLVATAGSFYAEENAYCLTTTTHMSSSSLKSNEQLSSQLSNIRERLIHPIYAEVEDGLG